MSKGLGFDYTNQEFMHKSKYVLENKSIKISRALNFKRLWSPDQKTTFILFYFFFINAENRFCLDLGCRRSSIQNIKAKRK